MAIFREFSADDIKNSKSFLNQLVDIINLDVSSSNTRKKYQVFVTGGLGPGVTSSLFQTVYDQNFTLQTANPIFDVTVGLHSGSEAITLANPIIDSNGKYLFNSNFLMMREKMDIYRLFAQELLGDGDSTFTAKVGANEYDIKHPMFIAFKRLFARDQIKRETFAIVVNPSQSNTVTGGNLYTVGQSTTKIYTDANSTTNKEYAFGGQVSTVVDSANTALGVGLLFIDKGVLVLDMSRSFDWKGPLSGTIDAVTTTGLQPNFTGSLRDLLMSGSIDDVVDHMTTTRFSGTTAGETAITFQNTTNINSTLFFCRLGADEFNYSSNPTYLDDDGRIVVIDEGQEDTQKSFTFVSSIGLYNAFGELLAVAKTSRPIYKSSDREILLKVRMDF